MKVNEDWNFQGKKATTKKCHRKYHKCDLYNNTFEGFSVRNKTKSV